MKLQTSTGTANASIILPGHIAKQLFLRLLLPPITHEPQNLKEGPALSSNSFQRQHKLPG